MRRWRIAISASHAVPAGTPPISVRALRWLVRMVPRGRYALIASPWARHGRFVARLADDLGGPRFVCDLGDDLAREAYLSGYYEPPVTRVALAHLHEGSVAVDAGANWGYFTLLSALAARASGSVIALEPDPRQFAALEANVALNALPSVQLIRAAASSAPGLVTLSGYADDEGNRGVSRLGGAAAGAPSFSVDAVTIDAVTAAHPVVDLVKIDVEGAEDLVLRGMEAGLAARRYRAIILELHPRLLEARGVDPASVVERLAGCGYRGATIDVSPSSYRRAARAGADIASLLCPVDDWRRTPWPHLLWLC